MILNKQPLGGGLMRQDIQDWKGKTVYMGIQCIVTWMYILLTEFNNTHTRNANLLTEKMLWWRQLTSQDTSSFPTKELNLMAVSLHAIPPVLVSVALLVYPETIKAPLQWHITGNKT